MQCSEFLQYEWHFTALWCAETGGVLIAPRPSAPNEPIFPAMPMRPFYGIEPALVEPDVVCPGHPSLAPPALAPPHFHSLSHSLHTHTHTHRFQINHRFYILYRFDILYRLSWNKLYKSQTDRSIYFSTVSCIPSR